MVVLVCGDVDAAVAELKLFLLINGRLLHTMGAWFDEEGVVIQELAAATRGKGVDSIGGVVRVGVVTHEATTGADGKKVSMEMSVDVGTSSMLLAKLEPLLFFFSIGCFFSGVLDSRLPSLNSLLRSKEGSFFCVSVERGLETGFFFLLMIGGNLSTSSGGLDGSFVPVDRKRR